ncbi:MAG: SpoIIE family protein phosphatase [Ruminococcus sp.]|nr:SpoIIE family protein phosphatase [Ruminococcus sp.]
MKKIKNNVILLNVLQMLLSFGGGFLLSGSTLGGVKSFADISLTGAVNLPCAASAFSGAVVRCVLTDSVGKCIVKLCAMAAIVIIKMFSTVFDKSLPCGILTASAVLASGCGISWIIGEFPEKLIFYILYGMIAGVTAYSASELWSSFSMENILNPKDKKGNPAGIVYVILSASLCSLDLPYFNIGLAVISAITILASCFLGGYGGIIFGALGASGAFFSSGETGTAAAILPVAGLITGLIGKNNFLFSTAAYTVSCFMLGLFMGDAYNFIYAISILGGSVLFLAAVPYLKDRDIFLQFNRNENFSERKCIKTDFLSDVIEAIRCDSGKISAAIAASNAAVKNENECINGVCEVCFRRDVCTGGITEISGDIVPVIPDDCISRKEAADEFERILRLRTTHRIMDLRYSEERRFLSEQFRIISDIIRETGESGNICYSDSLVKRIETSLKNHNIKFQRVVAGYTQTERITAEIFFSCGEIADSAERICGILSDTLGIRLMPSAVVSSAKELKIGVYQPGIYEIEIHSASKCAAGCKICGDSASVFTDSTGKQYIVLSDGMGSGKNAAVDSHMVIGMFRRLICGGMKPQSAVRVVNSVMVTKSREESFATLDALIIDPDSCSAVSVKSGAAPTIIRKGSDVIKLSSTVFPIGIVEEAELHETEHSLSDGDIIIMFSDGITENAYLFIKELLLSRSDIKEIVREIALKAEVFNPSVRSDDVTVIGMKVVKSINNKNM